MWLQHSSPFLNNFSSISFWAKSPYWHCSRFPEHRRIKRQNVVPFSNITKLHRVWWCFLFRAQVVFVIQIFPTDAYWFVLQIFLGVLYCSKYSTKTIRIVSKARGCNILQYIIPRSFCLTWLHTKCAQAISRSPFSRDCTCYIVHLPLRTPAKICAGLVSVDSLGCCNEPLRNVLL